MTDPRDDAPTRRYPKGVQRRKQILDEAIAMFAERGVDGSSLRSVGDAIGVSHTALRHYFPSRDDMLVEVYQEHEAQNPARPPVNAMPAVEWMARSADLNKSVPGLVRLYATLTSDALQEQHAVTKEYVLERFRSVREDLAARIRVGQAAGEIATDIDAADAASLIIAASDGLQVQWLLEPDVVDVRRSLELLKRLLPGVETDADPA